MVYGRQNEYYTLESLLLLWENREMQHTAYVKDASGKGIQCVTRPDRYVSRLDLELSGRCVFFSFFSIKLETERIEISFSLVLVPYLKQFPCCSCLFASLKTNQSCGSLSGLQVLFLMFLSPSYFLFLNNPKSFPLTS